MAKQHPTKNRKQEPQPEKEIYREDLPSLELEDKLPEEVLQIVKKLPASDRGKIIQALIVTKSTSFHGPIPPPELLKGYNDVIPNGAERIMSSAEKQSEHRMELEKYAIREQHNQSSRGQWFGFIIGLAGLGISCFSALNGRYFCHCSCYYNDYWSLFDFCSREDSSKQILER